MMDSVLSGYISAISVVIVYHLFSMQSWLDAVTGQANEAEQVKATTDTSHPSRRRVERRLTQLVKRFPLMQVAILTAAMAALTALTVIGAPELDDVRPLFTVGPAAILDLLFVAVTAATWLRGRGLAHAACADL